MLQAVQNDINKREELLNYVFEHRRKDEEAELAAQELQGSSEETSSLIISAISTSALNTANQSSSQLPQDD